MLAYKPIENRQKYHYKFRGPILIHAGKKRNWYTVEAIEFYRRLGWEVPPWDELPVGKIIGAAVLKDVLLIGQRTVPAYRDVLSHPTASGPTCLVLEQPVRFKMPRAAMGCQGLWNYNGPLEQWPELTAYAASGAGTLPACRHCGEVFPVDRLRDGMIPTHDFPKPCRSVCPGSRQLPFGEPIGGGH